MYTYAITNHETSCKMSVLFILPPGSNLKISKLKLNQANLLVNFQYFMIHESTPKNITLHSPFKAQWLLYVQLLKDCTLPKEHTCLE
jgi:hypothetical protein